MSGLSITAGVISLIVTAIAVTLAVKAVRSMLSVIRAGQPAVGRTDARGRRLRNMLVETVGHTRMLQRHWVGVMHWFVAVSYTHLTLPTKRIV